MHCLERLLFWLNEMKLLITGSSGYVGSVLAKHFSEKGADVVGLDLAKHPVWRGNKHFKFYSCDVTDKRLVKEIFSAEKPTHVIHLAYLMSPIHDYIREDEVDIDGTKNVFEAANETRSVNQFIEMSSSSAYGGWPDNKPWIKETQPLRPKDFRYAVNKKTVERYLHSYRKRKGMKLVILRMCTAIGPFYFKKGGVVSTLVNAPFFLKVNGRYCEVQFIHEEDLTSLFDKITNDKTVQGTYNLAPDSYATTKDFNPDKTFVYVPLWLLKGAMKILWASRLVPETPGAMDLITYGIVVDPHKLMKRYNYKFKYSTLEAFRNTVEQRKRNGTL
jgi:UDP-glucose 4-epimerase